jgi:CRP-like cAMP-binding protein
MQGERTERVYSLRSGWAYRYSVTRDGRRQILSLLLPGDLVGRSGLFQDRWTYSVRTLSRVIVCEFPRELILSKLMAEPDALSDTLKSYSQDQNESDEIVLSLGARTALERLSHFILLLQKRVARLSQEAIEYPETFEVPLRRDDIADALGMTPVHVSRSLRKLHDLGFVRFSRGQISVYSQTELRKLADA